MTVSKKQSGRLILVGGGPGDSGLFTYRAVECLRRSDVVVYDPVFERSIRQFIAPDCELIPLGTVPREEMLSYIARKTQMGSLVSMVTAGDPFLFGNASPIALECRNTGIPVEVVAGVSLPVSGPMYAGIPVMHEGVAQSLLILNGPYDLPESLHLVAEPDPESSDSHKKRPGIQIKRRRKSNDAAEVPKFWSPDDTINPDAQRAASPSEPDEESMPAATDEGWIGAVKRADTVVMLHGARQLGAISQGLLLAGREKKEPVAAMIYPGTQRQTTHLTTIGEMEEDLARLNMPEPVILALGETIGMRETLDFFETRPLFGQRVATLDAAQWTSLDTQRALEDSGAEVESIPVLKSRPLQGLDLVLRSLADDLRMATHLVFSDSIAARLFFETINTARLDVRIIPEACEILVMDEETRQTVREYAMQATYLEGGYSTTRLLDYLDYDMKHDRLITIGRTRPNKRLTREIRMRGGCVVEVPMYEVAPSLETMDTLRKYLESFAIDILICQSSLPLEAMHEKWGAKDFHRLLEDCLIACQGKSTVHTAKRQGLKQILPVTTPTPEALLYALIEWRQAPESETELL